jgi:hypothetical protein
MLGALLAGVRRAWPYVGDAAAAEGLATTHSNALFRMLHVAPFGVAVQALALLLQLSAGAGAVSDRFYRCAANPLVGFRVLRCPLPCCARHDSLRHTASAAAPHARADQNRLHTESGSVCTQKLCPMGSLTWSQSSMSAMLRRSFDAWMGGPCVAAPAQTHCCPYK